MDFGIRGRRAVVAASSAGLGLASARALAAEGVRLVINGRDQERLSHAADELRREGADVVSIPGSVGTPDGAEAFAGAAADALGGIDILVTNAGGPPPGTFASTDMEAYRSALDLNLLSTVALCRTAVPMMQAAGWGRVVAITSIAARQPIPTLMTSVVARAGVTGFLKVLATEVAPDGVTVNSVQPGVHRTDRLASLGSGDLERLAEDVPAGVIGDPGDFGSVVAFLCSLQAGFVTGVALPVDGGATRSIL